MSDLSYFRDMNLSENAQVKDCVFGTLLLGIGTIKKIYNKGTRADVTLPYFDMNKQPVSVSGVELVRTGTSKVSVFIEPEVGDCVLLFATQQYVPELKNGGSPEEAPFAPAYGKANIKGILVQPNAEPKDSLNIHIDDKQNITIAIKGKTTITCKDEVAITAEKKSTITCKAETTVDASGQNVTLKSSKTTVNDHLEIT